LRASKPVFDEAFDELEKTPEFGEGRVSSAGAAINWLVTDTVSLAGRYIYSSSKNTGIDLKGNNYKGNDLPLIPRHFLNLSSFWQLGGRWLLSTVATYRSQRYADEANADSLDPGWNFGLRSYWETDDKRWSVEAAANNLHADKHSALVRRAELTLNSTYRF
jgi:outer membrane receptor protein involved in Fe transport